MNIYQKLVEIRKDVSGFSKDGKSYGYTYVTGNQILRAIKEKMDELQVLLIPCVDYETLQWEKHEYSNKKGDEKLDFIVQARMVYKWINAEEPTEIIEVPWLMIGQQADDISKAVGTALTYNERYFLLKQFGLPTDEDDADKKPEADYGGSAKRNGLSDAQVKRLYAISNKAGKTPADVLTVCKATYKVNKVEDLTKVQYDAICKRLEDLVK